MHNPRIIVIIQARYGSLRLPGKILKELDGKPLIGHTIERCLAAKNVDEVILATANTPENDPVEKFCNNNHFKIYRGSEDDVLSRYIDAASSYNPDYIVRICGDEPLLDTNILEKSIQNHFESKCDYSTTIHTSTYGAVPKGLDIEIVNYVILKEVNNISTEKPHREHVTKYILDNPSKYSINKIMFDESIARRDISLTVDTREDFKFVKKIYQKIKAENPEKPIERIIEIVDSKIITRKPIILIRADGSKQKGMGDLVTCINLAKELESVYEILFCSKAYPEGVDFIKRKGYEVIELSLNWTDNQDIQYIREVSEERKIKYGIIELVPNNSNYVKELSEFLKTAMIDFEGKIDVYSDILIRWDLDSNQSDYFFKNENCTKLIGPDFIPLNSEIKKYKRNKQNNNINNIIVTFGGSDPNNHTIQVLNNMIKNNLSEKYRIKAIIGPGYKETKDIKELVRKSEIELIFSPKNIFQIFQDADLIICAGGFTVFELCSIGIPFIGISEISWEIKRLKLLEKKGICKYIDPETNYNTLIDEIEKLEKIDIRELMIKNGRSIIDGKGIKRISETISNTFI